ncbi:hypothetical protein Aph02nite_71380 [Actinoplanes philippinensis]|uniref:Uncharacterized protein n=1 Tax=Actinoplanes philippinensis TaxID=35752 RepID=A0A1I2K3A2_9ACTN|nr:hypothetical protein [Actinoplanes philippinensis]GIE81188.1 hypothetical protein Aph02nite_71380 [Actinoplanes philippinensis]SFF59521.1 hypothetical protein SAMN05421541_114174 [Actinoplanes philippinensis]
MRKSFVRRGLAAALAVFTGLTAVALTAAPAQADPTLAGVTLSTGTVVLDGDAGCANRVKVTYKVYDPANDAYVTGDVLGSDGDMVDFLFPSQSSRSGDYVYLTDWIFICGGFDPVGRYTIRTELEWTDDDFNSHVAERVDTFYVKRPTSLSYNATPEPVKKNSALTQTGVVKADPVGYGAKYGLKGAVVKFYFKADGAKAYVYQGQTTTGTGGRYSKKIKATRSGLWKAVYEGNSFRQAQTAYDAVKVR